MKQRRIIYKKSLEMSLRAQFLRSLLSLLPLEETEAIAITQEELDRLIVELHKMWDIP